ncbi:MAG: hypothetical protein IID41_01015 [Planctomycetes bacterium]|nr:hypothetical protein [Planctomycetota bacterium]
MSVSTTLGMSTTGGGTVVTKSVTISDEAMLDLEFTVDDGETDEEHNIDLDVSAMKMLYINSTQAITMEWNDNAGTQGSIVFVANEPVIWWSTQKTKDGSTLNPLGTVDVTTTFWTNASGSTATINFKAIYDASP